jgi:hypothetical protein
MTPSSAICVFVSPTFSFFSSPVVYFTPAAGEVTISIGSPSWW